MKTKYTNFKYWASTAPEPKFVPEHLIRKHWTLQFFEFAHIVVCIIFGFNIYSDFSKGLFFRAAAFTILLVMFSIAVYLSINDNHRFRAAIMVSHGLAASFALMALLFNSINLFLFCLLIVQNILVLSVVFLLNKNKEYYRWCKSITN